MTLILVPACRAFESEPIATRASIFSQFQRRGRLCCFNTVANVASLVCRTVVGKNLESFEGLSRMPILIMQVWQ